MVADPANLHLFVKFSPIAEVVEDLPFELTRTWVIVGWVKLDIVGKPLTITAAPSCIFGAGHLIWICE